MTRLEEQTASMRADAEAIDCYIENIKRLTNDYDEVVERLLKVKEELYNIAELVEKNY